MGGLIEERRWGTETSGRCVFLAYYLHVYSGAWRRAVLLLMPNFLIEFAIMFFLLLSYLLPTPGLPPRFTQVAWDAGLR